jgi:hypothetical protein
MFTTSGLIIGVIVLWFVLFLAFLIGEPSDEITTKEWLLSALIMSVIFTVIISVLFVVFYKFATVMAILFPVF